MVSNSINLRDTPVKSTKEQYSNSPKNKTPPITCKTPLLPAFPERLEIVRHYKKGNSIHTLAKHFGRDRKTVREILSTWKSKSPLEPKPHPGPGFTVSTKPFRAALVKIVPQRVHISGATG